LQDLLINELAKICWNASQLLILSYSYHFPGPCFPLTWKLFLWYYVYLWWIVIHYRCVHGKGSHLSQGWIETREGLWGNYELHDWWSFFLFWIWLRLKNFSMDCHFLTFLAWKTIAVVSSNAPSLLFPSGRTAHSDSRILLYTSEVFLLEVFSDPLRQDTTKACTVL
jgi:hypothetical protein